MKNPTCTEIAENFDLWVECIDPHATMTREEFEDSSVEERLATIRELYPQECGDQHQLSRFRTSRRLSWLRRWRG